MFRSTLLALTVLSASLTATAATVQEHFFGNAIEAGVIYIDGPFDQGLTESVKRYIQSEGVEARRVLLNSPGGSLHEGMMLGEFIREQGYSTEVGRLSGTPDDWDRELIEGRCASACALAFLGGSERSPAAVPYLGFHQFHEGNALYRGSEFLPSRIRAEGLSDAQQISGAIVAYMVFLGIDARLFQVSTEAGMNDLRYLTEEEAIEYRVITPRTFDSWFLDPYKDGVVAAAKRLTATGPYDQVTQSTVYCRSEGRQPYVLLSVKLDPGDDMGTLQGYGVRIYTLSLQNTTTDVRVPKERVKSFVSMGHLQVEVGLTSGDAAAISQATQFGVMLDAPRVVGGYQVSHRLSEQDRKMIEAGFRLCI